MREEGWRDGGEHKGEVGRRKGRGGGGGEGGEGGSVQIEETDSGIRGKEEKCMPHSVLKHNPVSPCPLQKSMMPSPPLPPPPPPPLLMVTDVVPSRNKQTRWHH